MRQLGGLRRGDKSMAGQLEQPLRAAIDFLESRGYRYAIIGGIALTYWGVVRATYDIDIKVLVPDMDFSALRSALREQFPETARDGAPRNPFIVSVMIRGVTVDFLLALPGYEELIIERAESGSLGRLTARICSAEDLIIQKVVAGRGKDWLYVESLLIARQEILDSAYIEHWLGQFAEALEEPNLLVEYRRIEEKTQRESQE
jgi:hypothetical protein